MGEREGHEVGLREEMPQLEPGRFQPIEQALCARKRTLSLFSTRANSGARCKESLQSAVDIDDALKVDRAPMLEPICAYQTREELALCRELSTRVP